MSDKQITLTNLSSFKQKYDAKMAAEMAQKQDVSPDGLKTSANTVVGAINELYDDIHEGGEGVTSLGGKQGDITLGEGLAIDENNVLSATGGSGVTSLGGVDGDVTLGTGLSMNGQELQVNITPGSKVYRYSVSVGNTNATMQNVMKYLRYAFPTMIQAQVQFSTNLRWRAVANGIVLNTNGTITTGTPNVAFGDGTSETYIFTPVMRYYTYDSIELESRSRDSSPYNDYKIRLSLAYSSTYSDNSITLEAFGWTYAYYSNQLYFIPKTQIEKTSGYNKANSWISSLNIYCLTNIDNLPNYITKTVM